MIEKQRPWTFAFFFSSRKCTYILPFSTVCKILTHTGPYKFGECGATWEFCENPPQLKTHSDHRHGNIHPHPMSVRSHCLALVQRLERVSSRWMLVIHTGAVSHWFTMFKHPTLRVLVSDLFSRWLHWWLWSFLAFKSLRRDKDGEAHSCSWVRAPETWKPRSLASSGARHLSRYKMTTSAMRLPSCTHEHLGLSTPG